MVSPRPHGSCRAWLLPAGSPAPVWGEAGGRWQGVCVWWQLIDLGRYSSEQQLAFSTAAGP